MNVPTLDQSKIGVLLGAMLFELKHWGVLPKKLTNFRTHVYICIDPVSGQIHETCKRF